MRIPIVIIDYGMGNLGSIRNMFKHIGVKAEISSCIDTIMNAEKLVLSGVGAFDNGIKNIKDSGLFEILNRKVLVENTLILGICLGMQLFTGKSEEGELPGLGWIEAETIRFRFENIPGRLKIPHMGWNVLKQKKPSRFLKDMHSDSRFYFVHSYHLVCADEKDILAQTDYGYEFVSAIERDNILGVQFHPEKSHKFGMVILKNFAGI